MDNNTTTTEENARQSSKLSLGSSPSVLSADEQLDGDGPLTPIDKMQDDVEDDDDDLSALNSILQAGSPGSLSDEEEEDDEEDGESEGDDEDEEDEDDLHTEQDSASPLSSVPDDFPLSRSASPDLPLLEKLNQEEEEADGEDEDEEDMTTTNATTANISAKEEEDNDDDDEEEVMEKIRNRKPSMIASSNSKKRRKDDTKKTNQVEPKEESDSEHGPSPPKKVKQSEVSTTKGSNKSTNTSSSSEDTIVNNNTKKRRTSRSILEITEAPRTRRRQSRQDDLIAKTEVEQIVEETPVTPKNEETTTESMDVDNESEEKEAHVETMNDENEKGPKLFDKQDNNNKETLTTEHEPTEGEQPENSEESEEQRGNDEVQDNEDHDYQHRHQEALDALTHIEVEFARLRDKMYQEKMAELHDEARMIADGTHPELVTLLAEIEEKKGKRIHSAEAWRKYQHDNFKQQFEGLEYQANIHFISQKNALRRDLLTKINGKRWNMEDERTKLNDPARGERVFPDGRELVAHKREQKEETGELQDIKEAIGFPMAPNPPGLSIQDVDDDLKLLGIKHS
ncbi:hypothetical protein INT46_003297 [Mucor plumbeus]|uniref:Uncharacterized protein n=1 Tax=Mucor plumbeus TaxID=97098 RepID=A0A8H7ULM7_9FUNG|nr:hypothetical protein INT46_003297 [Mucor plumbeus]